MKGRNVREEVRGEMDMDESEGPRLKLYDKNNALYQNASVQSVIRIVPF